MEFVKFSLLGALVLTSGLQVAQAASGPIKIGEINSYSTIPQFTQPYRQGWQLAVEEVNVAGGLLGRKGEGSTRAEAGEGRAA